MNDLLELTYFAKSPEMLLAPKATVNVLQPLIGRTHYHQSLHENKS